MSKKRNKAKINKPKTKPKTMILHLQDVLVSLIISACISAVLLYAMFKLLPEHSWISLDVTPDNYALNNFTGKMYSEFNSININQGQLVNNDSIILNIDDKKYELEESEFKVEFNMYRDAVKYDGLPYTNFSIFTPHQANIYATLDSKPSIRNSMVEVKKGSYLYKSLLGGSFEDVNQYRINFKSEIISELHMSVLNNTMIENIGGFDIYIKEDKVSIDPLSTIIVKAKDESIGNVNFKLKSNDFGIILRESDIVYCEGIIEEFNGKSDDGFLKHTYLGEQNEYELKKIVNYGQYSEEPLNFQLELSENKHIMNINGFVDELKIANTSLYFKFTVFIAKNIDNIVLTVFTAFIATYIPFAYNRKE